MEQRVTARVEFEVNIVVREIQSAESSASLSGKRSMGGSVSERNTEGRVVPSTGPVQPVEKPAGFDAAYQRVRESHNQYLEDVARSNNRPKMNKSNG